ncbi:MAG: hypothetical protein RR573_11085, partial [Oscillospiraceae bacterium]
KASSSSFEKEDVDSDIGTAPVHSIDNTDDSDDNVPVSESDVEPPEAPEPLELPENQEPPEASEPESTDN